MPSPPRDSMTAGAPVSTSRSLGLDGFRGLIIGWLIVLVHTPTLTIRGHAVWWGFDHSDVFFPAFLFVAGCGLAYQTRDKPMPWGRLAKRFVILTVLGLFVNAWLARGADLTDLRFTGVLQRIALVGIIGAGVAVAVRRRWLPTLVIAMAMALAWSLILFAASGDCPGHRPTPDGCGTGLAVDEAVFGAEHLYRLGEAGHDPEGLPSSIGALATFLAGYAAVRAGARPRQLLLQAAAWAVLAVPLLMLQPMAKRLWTGSYVAVTAAGCLLILAVLVAVFDRTEGLRRRAWPVVALGRNALVIWTGVFLTEGVLRQTMVDGVPLEQWFLAEYGAWPYFLVFGGGWFVIAWAMHATKWHVRL